MPPSPESLLNFVDYAGLLRLALEAYLAVVLGVSGSLSAVAVVARLKSSVPRPRRARLPAWLRHPLGGHHAH